MKSLQKHAIARLAIVGLLIAYAVIVHVRFA
jgi:hypothetical protein